MSAVAETLVPTMLDSEPIAAETPSSRPEPVAANERIAAVDVLRGFALLGILAMNIVAFGWPGGAYENPTLGGGFSGLDRVIWAFNYLFFEMKMMTLFSMLFGAGLVLMGERSDRRGASMRGVYYRRCLWLLVIGLVHSYLIWSGDILVMYAECGLIIYLFRRWRPRTLIPVGVVFLCVLVPIIVGFAAGFDFLENTAKKAEAAEKAGQQPTRFQAWIYHDVWTAKILPELDPESPKRKEAIEKSITLHRGGLCGDLEGACQEVVLRPDVGIHPGRLLAGRRPDVDRHGLDEARRVLRSSLSPVLYRACTVGLWHRPASGGVRRLYADPHQFRLPVPAPRRNFPQLLRQRAGGARACRRAHADLQGRPADVADKPAGRRGPHGTDELSDAFDRLHDSVLRLRLWCGRACQPDGTGGHRAGDLACPVVGQPDLAGTLPIRAGGVAMAVAHLLEAAADGPQCRASC